MKIFPLISSCLLVLLLSQCSDKSMTSEQPIVAASSREAGLASSVLTELNSYRQANGKKNLSRQSKLDSIAQKISQEMASNGRAVVSNIDSHRRTSGYSRLGQLVASVRDRGDGTEARVVDVWKGKESSEKIILASWQKIGIGVSISKEGLSYTTLVLGSYGSVRSIGLGEPMLSPSGF